jgi:hypothetical protein
MYNPEPISDIACSGRPVFFIRNVHCKSFQPIHNITMAKAFCILVVLCVAVFFVQAQDLVKTVPEKKVALIEQFTGVRNIACPEGHTELKRILEHNPDAIAVAYCPSNSAFTEPYGSIVDLRRSFADAFYTYPYFGERARSMPTGYINRRKFSQDYGRRLRPSSWSPNADVINQETSPVNMGLESIYDSKFGELVITTEMYFTQDVNNKIGLYIYITEDSISTPQSGSTVRPYYHHHVFRENITSGQWGDLITESTVSRQLVQKTHTFHFSTAIDPLAVEHCDIVAFLYDQTTEEIITGATVKAKNGTTRDVTTGINGPRKDIPMSMSPNPVQDVATIRFSATGASPVSLQVFDVLGAKVLERSIQAQPGSNVARISSRELGLTAGSYFVRVDDGEKAGVVKMLVK